MLHHLKNHYRVSRINNKKDCFLMVILKYIRRLGKQFLIGYFQLFKLWHTSFMNKYTQIFLAMTLILGCSSLTQAADWAMWRGDAQRSGYQELETILKPPLKKSWHQLGGENHNIIIESSPIIYEGKVFQTTFGDLDSGNEDAAAFYAFDLETGEELWSTLDSGIMGALSTAAAADGMVVFSSEDGNLYCFDADTGEKLWETRIAPDGTRSYSSPVIRDGKIYLGTIGTGSFGEYLPHLYIVDAVNGSIIGQHIMDVNFSIYGSVALKDDFLFLGAGGYDLTDGYLMCFDITDPSNIVEIWRRPLQGRAMNTPAVSDGFVYYLPANYALSTGLPSHLYAYTADENGTLIRDFEFPETINAYTSPAIAYDTLYFGTGDFAAPVFRAVDVTKFHNFDANPYRWEYHPPAQESSPFTGSPAVANGYVYATMDDTGTFDGAFYGFDALTGERVFYYTGHEGVGSSQAGPAVSDGHVIFVSYDDNDRYEQGVYSFIMDEIVSPPHGIRKKGIPIEQDGGCEEGPPCY